MPANGGTLTGVAAAMPGARFEPLHQLVEEANAPFAIAILTIGDRKIDEHQPVGGEAHVDALEAKHRPREQTGRGDDDHRQRHLHDDQRSPPAPRRRWRRASSAATQRVDEIVTGHEERRRHPGASRCQERYGHREGDDAGVDAYGIDTRQPVGNERNERLQ